MKKSFVVILCILSSLLMCSCSKETPQDETKLRIAVVTWVNHGPFYLAKEKGFYSKYGIDVDIQKIEELSSRRASLLSGNLDGMISSVDSFAIDASYGVKAKTIMKLGAGNGSDAIVAMSEIKSIKDLKGHTVAFEKGTPSHFFLLLAMQKEGLSIKDIKPVYMTAGDAGATYVAGRVDACVTWEPWVTTATEKRDSNVLVTSKNMHGILVDTFVMSDDILKEKPGAIKAFLNGWFDAIEYWKNNPEEANKIMADSLGIPISDFEAMLQTVILSDYQDNLNYFGTSEHPGQYWDIFDSANTIWKNEGLIENPVNPKEYTDTSFLHSIER